MKQIKSIIRSIAVAFSIYSKIPMPGFEWNSEDMKYHFIFFPWVGMAIGALEYLWFRIASLAGVQPVAAGLISVCVVLLVTGGLHADGFMDTCDALHSYRDREKKLEILKDPHIGAFSVICLAILLMAAAAAGIQIMDSALPEAVICVCIYFAAARSQSGIMALTLAPSKKDGMLRSETDNSSRNTVRTVLIVELVIFTLVMAAFSVYLTVTIAAVEIIVTLYFIHMCKKEFGGISGDPAGYYVCISEAAAAVCAAVYSVVIL